MAEKPVIEDQAKAWEAVWEHCLKLGMDISLIPIVSGVEVVKHFITNRGK